MTKYTIKYVSGTNYNLYEDGTLVTDFTVFTSAGSAYFVIDLNSSVPTTLDAFTIVDSNSDAVISANALTDELEDGATFKGAWSAGTIPNTFTSFTKLEGVSMDESQISFLMSNIKKGINAKEITSFTYAFDLPVGLYKVATRTLIGLTGTTALVSRTFNNVTNLAVDDEGYVYFLIYSSRVGVNQKMLFALGTATGGGATVYVTQLSFSGTNYSESQRTAGNGATGSFDYLFTVTDNLSSQLPGAPLSANQGRVLNNNKLAHANLQAGNGITITTTGSNANTVKTISTAAILSGTSDPTSSQGEDGDLYIKYEEV